MKVGIYHRRPDWVWDHVIAGYFDGSDEMADFYNLKKVSNNLWKFSEDFYVQRGDFIAKPLFGPQDSLKVYHGGIVSDDGFMNRYREEDE